jgi:hypothetical protein
MADYAVQARDMGINFIGACCGTVAVHFREMARALDKLPEDLEERRRETDVGVRVLRPRQTEGGREIEMRMRVIPGPHREYYSLLSNVSCARFLCMYQRRINQVFA